MKKVFDLAAMLISGFLLAMRWPFAALDSIGRYRDWQDLVNNIIPHAISKVGEMKMPNIEITDWLLLCIFIVSCLSFLSSHVPQIKRIFELKNPFRDRYAPIIQCELDNTYQPNDDSQCKLFFRLKAETNYPYGDMYMNFINAIVTVTQKRFGKIRRFKFVLHQVRTESVKIQPGAYFDYDPVFSWDNEGRPKALGPDLSYEFTWELAGLKANLDGLSQIEVLLESFKGRWKGKAYGLKPSEEARQA